MEIPTLDAKIGEDGNVVYIGKDGKEVEIGEANKFFNLDDLTKKDKDLSAENTVKDSNTVKVYLDKNRFLRIFKKFLDEKGKEILENRPEVKFEIYQNELDENDQPIEGKKVLMKGEDGKKLLLVANEKNNFSDMVKNLPIFKKSIEIDGDGNITEKVVRYGYEIKEDGASGYRLETKEGLDGDTLGFVIKAINTKIPDKPNYPNNPPEEPDKPEKPEKPKDKDKPEKPTEKDKDKPGIPKKPEKPEKPEKPDKPKRPRIPEYPKRPRLPQTGAISDFTLMYLSGLILILAIIARKKVRE